METGGAFGPIQIWQSMGTVGHLVLGFLFLMSVGSLGIMLDRWLYFRRAQRQSRDYVAAVRPLLAQDRLAEAAEEAAKYPQSHLARVHAAVLREALPGFRRAGGDEAPEELLRHAADRESALISLDFRRGFSGLASIGATAPFVGLFGTVIGIMNSFFAMARTGSGGIGAVSGGIAEALVNTAVGILVALPAVWAFNHLLGRMERVRSEADNAGSELIDYLVQGTRRDAWRLEATTGHEARR
jgi:biopolymer transport protein ExbB/biopolymer transport protein TolQ